MKDVAWPEDRTCNLLNTIRTAYLTDLAGPALWHWKRYLTHRQKAKAHASLQSCQSLCCLNARTRWNSLEWLHTYTVTFNPKIKIHYINALAELSLLFAGHFHISLASHFGTDTDKQCRPRSNAAQCGVWSGSTLFAYSRVPTENTKQNSMIFPQ